MIDKSWIKKSEERAKEHYSFSFNEIEEAAEESYLAGASDFQEKLLDSLQNFTVLTNDEVFLHNNKTYVNLSDIIELVKGLYSETIVTEI